MRQSDWEILVKDNLYSTPGGGCVTAGLWPREGEGWAKISNRAKAEWNDLSGPLGPPDFGVYSPR